MKKTFIITILLSMTLISLTARSARADFWRELGCLFGGCNPKPSQPKPSQPQIPVTPETPVTPVTPGTPGTPNNEEFPRAVPPAHTTGGSLTSQDCPQVYSPLPFQGRTGKVASYNPLNMPLTVVLYHPNSRSIYDRYTVPPRQNQFLGNNIIVGDDWGVCFENKPGASGFVNNLGTISDYNPNYQGIPLFMIQNGRIR